MIAEIKVTQWTCLTAEWRGQRKKISELDENNRNFPI